MAARSESITVRTTVRCGEDNAWNACAMSRLSSSRPSEFFLSDRAVSPELVVLATGAGAVMFGPMNDSGFWQVRDALGLTVPQTLRTWSVLETLIGVVGLVMCVLLQACGL